MTTLSIETSVKNPNFHQVLEVDWARLLAMHDMLKLLEHFNQTYRIILEVIDFFYTGARTFGHSVELPPEL